MVCKTHKYGNGGRVKNYADGGEVEKPTYMGAVKDRVKEVMGLGPKAVKENSGLTGNAARALKDRKKQLDSYKDGGKVKRKC